MSGSIKNRDLFFQIPECDRMEFEALPEKVRQYLLLLLLALEEVHAAPKANPAIRQVAARWRGRRGLSFETIRRKFYLFTGCGDWRCLLDRTALPRRCRGEVAKEPGLAPDFIEYLKGLFQSNQRKSEPAIRLLYRNWREGLEIPGYGTWQERFQVEHPGIPLPSQCPALPRGWSKANLRRHIPEQAELALARRGSAAALELLPDILTTREGLRPLEYIMFDDFRTDFKIMVPGYPAPVELNGLVALDVATGRPLRYGLRPAIEREDGVKDKLKLRDMKCLVAGILLQYGVPRCYPMHLVVENATATIRDAFAAALDDLAKSFRPAQSGSRPEDEQGYTVQVHKTQLICGTSTWAGFRERAGGNPQGKAALESTFNLLHNEAAFLPGQTGSRYDNGPSELAGRTNEAIALARTARHLTAFQRAQLKWPFLNYAQARCVLTDLFDRIAARTDHQMEAFQVVGEFREQDFEGWRPESELMSLPPERRKTVTWRNPPRRESPMERWARLFELAGGKAAFAEVSASRAARLYEEHRLAVVHGFEIAFTYEKQSFHYRIAEARLASPGCVAALKNGCRVLCYFDPQDLSWVHCSSGDGGYLGSIPRTVPLRRTDKEALKQEFNRKRTQLRGLQDTVTGRMPLATEERLADIGQNVEVLSGALQDGGAIEPSEAMTAGDEIPPRHSVTNDLDARCDAVPSYARLLDSSGSTSLVPHRSPAKSTAEPITALLRDVRTAFQRARTKKLFTSALLSFLLEPGRPWATAKAGNRPIDSIWLSKQLRAVGVGPRTLRIGDRMAKGYQAEDFDSAFRGVDHGRWSTSAAPRNGVLSPR